MMISENSILEWVSDFYTENERLPKRQELVTAPFSWTTLQRLFPGGFENICNKLCITYPYIKYEVELRLCPVCRTAYKSSSGGKRARKFCSKACANKAVHTKTGQYSKDKPCKTCNRPTKGYVDYCSPLCKLQARYVGKTKKDLCGARKDANRYGIIRQIARRVASLTRLLECQECGYKRAVDIAHVKPISDFGDSALILTINDPTNLMCLCKRCHHEFDRLNTSEENALIIARHRLKFE